MALERLGDGSLLGLDRSAIAVAAAEERNRAAVTQGRAEFRAVAFEDVDPADLGRFDMAFAVSVNLFWTRPAQHELRLVAALLRPAGLLWLCYDPPDAGTVGRLESQLVPRLEQGGYRYRTTTTRTERTTFFAITAAPEPNEADVASRRR